MIKIIVALSTVLVGTYITRFELRSIISSLTEKEYVSWNDFEQKLEKNRMLIKQQV